MRKSIVFFAASCAVVFMSFPVFAEDASVELGKKLFNDSGLGASKNSTSCNVCHPNGEGLQNAGKNPQLTKMINKCIVGPLQGEKLNEQTVAMQSLKMYIESLGKK
ncbi:MAG: cytochrome-c peroxidase [Desulfobulbaceae bacterium]|nr:cytochrome-c peroxidase [Desulfobulbaceae bacterium]